MLITGPNHIKSKSYSNIEKKNYYNISDEMTVQQLLSDDSKSSIENCNISKENNEIFWIEKCQQPTLIALRAKVLITIIIATAIVIDWVVKSESQMIKKVLSSFVI